MSTYSRFGIFAGWFALSSIVSGPAGAQTNSQQADLLIIHGKVYTADRGGFQEAVAIRGNKILQTGSADEILKLRGPKTEVIDAQGGAVVPGFNDTHTHLLQGGMALNNVKLEDARTLDAVQDRIRTFAAAHPERAWIQGMGWRYEPFPRSLPTKEQLDAVLPDRPAIMTCFDAHSVWVNSKALALAGIGKNTPDPPNGVIVRDPDTGEPTGLLKETPAMALVQKVVPKPSRKEQLAALRAASAEALRSGVTSVTDAAGNPEDMEAYDEARRTGDLSVRVNYSLLAMPGFTEQDADRFDKVWRSHPDSAMLKTGVIKMFMDGVIETNTAYMLANYANTPSHGKPNYTVDDFNRIIQMMDRRGWQIMVHALGDAAVRMTLDGFERLAKVNSVPVRGRRDRIEHIETIDPADVPRFGKLGVIAAMHPGGGFFPPNRANSTPGFVLGVWGRNLGPERAARGGMWKSISDAGGRVIFGSDWPVASLDAMGRIYGITHRVPIAGRTDQRLPLTTAIDDYTRESAYATFDEKQKGMLAPGMLADVAVLATDVFSHEPAAAADLAVKFTVMDGKVVYRAAGESAVAQASLPQQDSSACRKFAQEFYDWYLPVSQKRAQEPAWSLAIQRKPEAFSADLLKALKIDSEAAAHAKDDIVGLDFDPFLGGQDPASHYEARGVSWQADKCSVEIWPATHGAAKPRKPDAVAELALTGGRWQFQNFRYPDPPSNLVDVLAQLRAERRKH